MTSSLPQGTPGAPCTPRDGSQLLTLPENLKADADLCLHHSSAGEGGQQHPPSPVSQPEPAPTALPAPHSRALPWHGHFTAQILLLCLVLCHFFFFIPAGSPAPSAVFTASSLTCPWDQAKAQAGQEEPLCPLQGVAEPALGPCGNKLCLLGHF